VGQRSDAASGVDRSDAAVAFDALYERCYPQVRAYVGRRVSSDRVDDIVADTFLVAWRKFDAVPSDSSALLWLYRVAYRAVGDHWRSLSRRRRLGDRIAALPSLHHDDPAEDALVDDEVQRVLAAAERLNPKDSEVLRLACWEGLTNSEIAAVLGLSANATAQRLHRARRNLTKRFDRLAGQDRATSSKHDGGTS
jgi:RNA polymerase sigma-70 factor (ECF subfamily)